MYSEFRMPPYPLRPSSLPRDSTDGASAVHAVAYSQCTVRRTVPVKLLRGP
jgi:hypothetical protein